MSSLFSIGLMNQLGNALQTAGYTPAQVSRLRAYGNLSDFRRVLAGTAEIIVRQHIIDCDAQPFMPNGWKVEEHTPGGQFEWDIEAISLYLSDEQQPCGKRKGGDELRKELAGKPVLNANVLDYLLAHTNLIPEEWKDKYLFFWGTIYLDSDGDRCVRYLHWRGSGPWGRGWLINSWDANDPAAVRK